MRFFLFLFLSFLPLSATRFNTEIYNEICEGARAFGVPEPFVSKAFFDQRTKLDTDAMKRFAHRGFLFDWLVGQDPIRVTRGKEFMCQKAVSLISARDRFGVPPALVSAIIGVETKYGSYCGFHDVFNVFYTLMKEVPSRHVWASKELCAFIKYCFDRTIDPHTIFGSYAGAFGYGQFLPTSFLAYAVDADGGGWSRHDSWPDVIASVANYLVKNGFQLTQSSYDKGSANWRSIFAYNHSSAYVKDVLSLKVALEN